MIMLRVMIRFRIRLRVKDRFKVRVKSGMDLVCHFWRGALKF